MQKGLNLADNIKCQENDIKIGVAQTYPIRVSWTLNERPKMVVVAQISEDVVEFVPVAAHVFQWRYENNQLQLLFTGLNSAKKYNVRIISFV